MIHYYDKLTGEDRAFEDTEDYEFCVEKGYAPPLSADFVSISDQPTVEHVYDGESGTWGLRLVELDEMRRERNTRLVDSDWRVLADYQGADKALWLVYRQELRDMTDGYIAVNSPIYPIEP